MKAVGRQIYSLLPLTTRAPAPNFHLVEKMELATGIGPVTCRLQGGCSTN